MIGTILNVAGIVIGAILGRFAKRPLSAANQSALKIALGLFAGFWGLKLTWQNLGDSPRNILRQLAIVVLALIVGKFTGRLLHLQKASNRLGQYARTKIERSGSTGQSPVSDGFTVCAALFCAAPLAPLGALTDGLSGYYQPLIIKAVMDGLATAAFAGMFGWGVVLSALPVLAWQGTVTLLAGWGAQNLAPELIQSINATAGLLVFCVALVILELKKVELADYLPSLFFAPLICWLWRA